VTAGGPQVRPRARHIEESHMRVSAGFFGTRANALIHVALCLGLCACSARIESSESSEGDAVGLSKGGGVPSTKAAAFYGDIAILRSTDLAWTSIMNTQIKTSNQKSLFINPSLECGLYTSTTVRSSGGRKDSSNATATIQMQVLVDGVAAQPGVVIYCSRSQTLSATLGGILNSCTDTDGDGTITASECDLTDEEITLVLDTMNASSFNFGANVGVGVHDIEVQARISTSTSAQTGSAAATATIGKGSVVVTEQRL
jgi:hypothetical protein